jgi:hypothetical protein
MHLGDKNRKDKWYDYLLAPPAFLVAIILGSITRIVDWIIK